MLSRKFYVDWAAKAISAVVVVSYLIAVFTVFDTALVPLRYVIAPFILSAAFVCALIFMLLRDNAKYLYKSTILIIISCLLIMSSCYVYVINASTNSFLGNIQNSGYTYESYSILARKASAVGINKNNKSIGYLQDDPNNATVLRAVHGKTEAKMKPYPNLTALVNALEFQEVDSVVARSSYLPVLSETYPDYYAGLHTIGTFKIKVKSESGRKVDINKPFVIYISGIDTYGEVATVSRSDVNILAVVNPKTHKILLVNTPRDYYVQLHGTSGTKDKLTHAGIYGIDMSKNTMQDLYATNINYTLRINFTSLLKTVDALGGVEVYSDNAFTVGKYTFVKGYNKLDAKQALAFSRERHSFSDGDRQRGKDQQRVIEAIIAKMSSPATLVRYPKIMKSLDGSFQTSASKSEISAILNQQANSLGKWQTESISVTGADSHNATYSMGSIQLYVMEPDVASVNNAKSKIHTYLQVPTKK